MSVDFNFQDSETDQENQELIEDNSRLNIRYIPEEIRHRDEQMEQIAEKTLSEVAGGKKGSDLLIVGPPGTGKTATVKYMVDQTRTHNDEDQFEILYVNCSTYSSGQALFKELCNKVEADFKPGVELAKNINRFKEKIREKGGKSVLIILDEIQELQSDRRDHLSKPVLYELSRPTEGQELDGWNGNITIAGISNDPEILEYIDDDVMSSMEGPQIVEFPTYTIDEMTDIVHSRQVEAYIEPVLSGSSVRKIAKEVRDNFNSDVRKTIEILKKIPGKVDNVDYLSTDEERQKQVVDEITTELQKDRIRKVCYSKEEDFYIVMSALHQQLLNDNAKLKHITEAYSEACEIAMREKKGSNFAARRSYVYRQLEKLVEDNLLEKKKSYKEMNKPNRYQANFDLGIFQEIIEDQLRRKDLLKNLKEGDYSVQAEEEAEEVLDAHMS
jgi:Cdc6-like AAA superfamily ATPase